MKSTDTGTPVRIVKASAPPKVGSRAPTETELARLAAAIRRDPSWQQP